MIVTINFLFQGLGARDAAAVWLSDTSSKNIQMKVILLDSLQ